MDPGVHGAMCLVENGEFVAMHDMPTLNITRNKKTRVTLDGYELARLVDDMVKIGIDKAYIEDVGGMPGQAGMFVFGRNVGIITGIIMAHFVPVELVHSQTWMRHMKVPRTTNAKGERTKDGTLLRIKELWPKHCGLFARKKDDGRADAALLALHGWMRQLESSYESQAQANMKAAFEDLYK